MRWNYRAYAELLPGLASRQPGAQRITASASPSPPEGGYVGIRDVVTAGVVASRCDTKRDKQWVTKTVQPTQILATKLYIPPLPPKAVLRPRLVERLR